MDDDESKDETLDSAKFERDVPASSTPRGSNTTTDPLVPPEPQPTSGKEDEPQSPNEKENDPQPSSDKEEESQSPTEKKNEPQSPSDKKNEPQSSSNKENEPQSPSNKEDESESPVDGEDESQSPSGEEKPIGPMLNTDKIISETEDICESNLKIYQKQKLFLTSLAYLTSSIQDLLSKQYRPFLRRVNAFLVNCSDELRKYHCNNTRWVISPYSDYLCVLSNDPGKVNVKGMPNTVVEADLRDIAETAYTNLYAGAVEVRTLSELNKNIDSRMGMRWSNSDLRGDWDNWFDAIRNQIESIDKKTLIVGAILVEIGFMKVDQSLTPMIGRGSIGSGGAV